MAYKFQKIIAKSPSLMLNQIRDFLVSCGWTNETPAAVLAEDPGNLVTPCFLKSTGEDGTEAIYFNLMSNVGYGTVTTVGRDQSPFTYLAASCSATDTTLSVDNSARFVGNQAFPYGGIVRIGNELIWFAYQATNSLYECKRGYLGTTAASHAADDHVLQEFNSYAPLQSAGPTIEAYAFRTLSPIASSSAVAFVSSSLTPSTALTGYETNRFAYNCFLRVTSGTMTGVMRRILLYNTTTGAFTFEPLNANPGTQTFEVVSCGFLPTMPRDSADYVTSYRKLPVIRSNYLYSTVNKPPQPQACYLYGSKDYLYVVVKTFSNSSIHFFGNVIRHAAKASALTTTAAVGPGTNLVINVNDVTPFYVGAKFRIMGQSVNDWINNRARTTFPGTTKLYSDEIPTEEITIGAVGATDITINGSILASYEVGAIIAEDPRPLITASHAAAAFDSIVSAYPCYYPKLFGVYYRQIAGSYGSNYAFLSLAGIGPGSGYAESPSWSTERNMGYVLTFTETNASYHANNIWEHVKGVLPNIWYLGTTGVMFGLPEDTFQARWNGAWYTFRLFSYDGTTTNWCVLGPEIAIV